MKKILYLLIITLFSVNISFAQFTDTTISINNPTLIMPVFPGGQEALTQFIIDQTVYPKQAKNSSITGNVYISFVVETDGSISNVEPAEQNKDLGIGESVDSSLVEEAIRVVKSMPNWIPGKQRGNLVRVHYVLPFEFTLTADEGETEKTKKELRKEKRKNKREKK